MADSGMLIAENAPVTSGSFTAISHQLSAIR